MNIGPNRSTARLSSDEAVKGWGAAVRSLGNRADWLIDYWRLDSDEARAVFADKWIRASVDDIDHLWPVFYGCLKIAKEMEIYKTAGWLEDKKVRSSFKEYWDEVIRKPFADWVELENTFNIIHEIEPDLLGKLKYTYTKAREVVLKQGRGPEPGSMTKTARASAPNLRDTKNKCKEGTQTAEYLRARLRRDHPAIAARVDAGEISARKGALEAGIVRPTAMFYTDSAEDAAHAIKRHFKGERRLVVIAILQETDRDEPGGRPAC
jgi:hypothetical protein